MSESGHSIDSSRTFDVDESPETIGTPKANDSSRKPPYTHTRASGFWAAVLVGLLVLTIFLIFILENDERAKVSFLGAHTQLQQGVALLLAAVIGGVVVALAGAARILQLRSRAKASGS